MTETDLDPDGAIAVVGMAGRFPGAASVEELWRNSLTGSGGLRTLTEQEMLDAGVSPAQLADPTYVRVGGPVADIDRFDAGLFGLTRREAEFTDPQHRVFAETCVEALENAGYPAMSTRQRVGVFGGSGFTEYLFSTLAHSTEPGDGLMLSVGTERDSLAPFVSYKLGLTGPSITVQTFCSTSLVAVHLAVQSLTTFECEMALAGGVFTPLAQGAGYQFEEGSIYSPDGRVRTFDASAGGSVMGSGASVVVLKRLSDALAEGCTISAVIRGSAVNNDGRTRVGFTAPGVEGEAQVMSDALAFAAVDPSTVDYIECHGTGTMLGDSIEIAAMDRAYPARPGDPIALGSLKPLIGHLDRAAGSSSLIRAAIALREGVLPAVHGFESPNAALAGAREKFVVHTRPQEWPRSARPRRAAVSAFGLGGVNAHVILEEPPERPPSSQRPGPHLLVLSARDEAALDEATQRLRQHLVDHPEVVFADVVHTQQVSRSQFEWRRSLVCEDTADAVAGLADPERLATVRTTSRRPVVRLTLPADVPDEWWRDLASVVGAAGEGGTTGSPSDVPVDVAARAVVRALADLGVRVTEVVGDAASPGLTSLAVPGSGPVVALLPDDGPVARWWMGAIGELWQAGADVRWRLLHGADARRVPLPVYPFQRRRYWLDAPGASFGTAPPVAQGRVDDLDSWAYLPTWRGSSPRRPSSGATVASPASWLILAADGRVETLIERLRESGADVVVARPGRRLDEISPADYEIRPGSVEDLTALLARLGTAPTTVVHAFGLTEMDEHDVAGPDPAETDRVRTLATLQALVSAYASQAPDAAVNLLVLTEGGLGVAGEAPRSTEAAAMEGMLPSLAQENPGWTCRLVDVDPSTESGLADAVVREVGRPFAGPVAVRGRSRWLRHYDPILLPPATAADEVLRPGAVVLLTGAMGYVGLTLATHLALARGCRLVLGSRTELPPREEWATAAGSATSLGVRVAALQRLVDAGADIEVVTMDVADAGAVRAGVDRAVAVHGRIDLVVHAAGISGPEGFGPAHLVDEAAVASHFAAKVEGLVNLDEALRDHDVPGLAFSSLSATLGGLALGPYAASNAALDAAVQRLRADGRRWASVQWDTWGRVESQEPPGDFDMRPEEALEIFDRLVAAIGEVTSVVISTGPLDPRVEQWVVEAGGADLDVDTGERDPRPDLTTPLVEPAPGLESELAAIWADVLRLETVGADDNFFLLGGTSVLAIGLVARVRSILKIAVPTSAVLGFPTVRGLAAQLQAMDPGDDGDGRVADDG